MKVRSISRATVLAVSVLVIGFVSAGEAQATHAVTSVSPGALPQGASSAPITITGTGFSDDLGPVTVTVAGGGVTVADVVVVSNTSITADVTVAPGAAASPRDVTISQGVLPDLDRSTCTGCLTINAAPEITGFTPPGAGNTGISPLGATGTGFVEGAQLLLRRAPFDDIVASSTTVNPGGTSISGSVDLTGAAPGRWIVVVVNPDGGVDTFGDGISSGFIVTSAAPTVASASPSTRAAGTTDSVLTVSGTNFAEGATFSFGEDVAVTDATWLSFTSYSVTVDIASDAVPGPRSVTVTNADSQTSGACSACFNVSAAPAITSVVPSSRGQGAVSEDLVVSGTGFATGATATVSGTGVTVESVDVDSATRLTVTVSVDSDAPATERTLTVLNPDGGTATSPFTVNLKPTISEMTPGSRGQNASTQEIVVTGANFVETPTIEVSGTDVTVDSVVFTSSTQLTLVVTISPTATVGPRDVTVTNPDGGTSTADDAFTVNVGPSIVSLTPDALAQGVDNHTVTVSGGGFAVTPTVTFSGTGVIVSSVTRDSNNQLTLDVSIADDADLGDRDVTVTNPDAGTVTAVAAFEVTAPPTISDVEPDNLGQGATADLTVTGSGFLTGAEVSVSGAGVAVTTVTVVSSTEITANVTVSDDAPPEARDVTVTNPDAGAATCAGCLTIGTGPTITSITPAGGPNSGTVTITSLAGSGFADDAVVQLERAGFDPVPMDGEAVNDAGTSITGSFDLTPAGDPPVAPGTWTVRVTNPGDGGSATLVDGFIVTGSVPNVTSASPAAVAQGTTPTVQVLGTGFAEDAVVGFSGTGITVTDTTVVSGTRIDVDLAVAIDAPTGARTITVTNTDGQSDTCVDCLTVDAASTTTSLSRPVMHRGASAPVTITGTGYQTGATVTASGTGVTFTNVVRVSATQLTATITVAPGATLGARTVTVTNPDAGVSTCGCLTIVAPGAIALDAFVSLGDVIRDGPAVVSTAPDSAGVFFRALNNTVAARGAFGTVSGSGTWSSPVSLGGFTPAGPAASDRGAAVDVVVRGGDNGVWLRACASGSCGGWSSIGGGTNFAPAAVSWGPDRLDVFVTGTDNQLWHRGRQSGVWGAWEPLGGFLTAGPAATSGAVGNIDVAVRGAGGAVWNRSVNSGPWGAWTSVGGFSLNQPAVVARPGGILELFVRGGDNALWSRRRTGGAWGPFQSLGGTLSAGPGAALMSTAPSNVIQIAVRGADGQLLVARARF